MLHITSMDLFPVPQHMSITISHHPVPLPGIRSASLQWWRCQQVLHPIVLVVWYIVQAVTIHTPGVSCVHRI